MLSLDSDAKMKDGWKRDEVQKAQGRAIHMK